MSELKLIPFKPEHLLSVSPQEQLPLTPEVLYRLGQEYSLSGPAFTVVVENRALGCGGVRILHRGVGEAWAVVSPEASRFAREVHYHAKSSLRDIIRSFRLRRLQAAVLASELRHRKWLERLGFSDPVLLRRFGPNGEDFVLYSIISA